MIKVLFWHDSNGNISRFKFTGHAGYANYGEDIVCSGISTLVTAIINGLEEIANIPISYQIQNGYADCTVLPGLSPMMQQQAQLLLKTLVLGAESIADEYGQYVQVRSITE